MQDTPLYDRLTAYRKKKRISFAMPGHKGGQGLDQRFKKQLHWYDVTELKDTEDLHAPGPALKRSQKILSDFAGSQESFYLTGGSTAGNFAMLIGTLCPGDLLIAERSCHKSVINAASLFGYRLAWLPQKVHPRFHIPLPPTAEDLKQALVKYPAAKAVFVTSPSYYGLCAGISGLSALAHKHGLPLLVDEAHGAHFMAGSSLFPPTALKGGADICVQSAHKTLNALTPAAYLHLGSSRHIHRERLICALSMVQTSSPPYMVAASGELAIAQLAQNRSKWNKTAVLVKQLKQDLTANTFIKCLENQDPARLVCNFSAYQTSGYAVCGFLRDQANIDIEMADAQNIVCIVTPSNTAGEIEALKQALFSISHKLPPVQDPTVFPSLEEEEQIFSPQDAFYRAGELIPLKGSEGRLCRSLITAYPPGTAIIAPGQRVCSGQIEQIILLRELGATLTGLTDHFEIEVGKEV